MLRLVFILILSALLCAPLFAQKKAVTPAGLDSTTKQEADSLAQQLFGEEKAETRALREFEKGKEDFQTGERFLAEADSMRRSGADTTLKRPGGVIGAVRQALGDTAVSSREKETRARAAAAFQRAAREFENSLKYAPESADAQLWLVATYDRLSEWKKSITLYREILNVRQGEDRLWFNYGYAALQAGEYPTAVNAFEQAIHISLLVNEDSAAVPHRYYTYAGEAFLRTYQDRLALQRFRTALNYASGEDSAQIARTIEWILWDDGGIATAEYRDAAFRAESESRWDDARKAYLGGLHSARTEAAKDELSYRLALLEFQHGTRSDGLARMKELVAVRSDLPPEWRENYGKMLFAYAQILEKESDKRGALSYFLQATKIPWSGQGAGFVEIARIAANDLDAVIEQATKALDYPLTSEQRNAAYQMLESAYRSKGNWEMMKKYRQLMEQTP